MYMKTVIGWDASNQSIIGSGEAESPISHLGVLVLVLVLVLVTNFEYCNNRPSDPVTAAYNGSL